MSERQSYNTKARRFILEYLSSVKEGTVGAADIIEHLNKKDISINKATVYRYLNRLTEEKQLLKFTDGKTQKSVYRLASKISNCEEHIHIKCTVCGRLHHLDCELMKEIREHLEKEHGFLLKCDGSILYGICSECKNNS